MQTSNMFFTVNYEMASAEAYIHLEHFISGLRSQQSQTIAMLQVGVALTNRL